MEKHKIEALMIMLERRMEWLSALRDYEYHQMNNIKASDNCVAKMEELDFVKTELQRLLNATN